MHKTDPNSPEFVAEFLAARARGKASLRTRPHAVAARYSKVAKAVVVSLRNGAAVSIPLAMIPGLAGASDAQLREVLVGPAGVGLHWERLDVDVSVAALAQMVLGTRTLMSAAGAAGGSARSQAKAIAARRNGKKGGRPRKSASLIRTSAGRV